ncbi:hypothetical protein BD289DRAFT_139320 [Coniella lustricola]|uniref:Helicase ATP-binding domain-containing protein n=1 Tax=Coniella lustricola TaxID=2025994 RepID=A0A2T3AF54_9PEZI|nr:hypothetical protein BD289DRAFT_139320 [Coniella lustricola]
MATSGDGLETDVMGRGGPEIDMHNQRQTNAARSSQVNSEAVPMTIEGFNKSVSAVSRTNKLPRELKRKSSFSKNRTVAASKKRRTIATPRPAKAGVSCPDVGLSDELARGGDAIEGNGDDGDTCKADESGPDTTKPPLFNLREIIDSMMKSALQVGLQHYVSSGKKYYIRVGTVCSGTDAPLHVMKLFGMLKNKSDQQVFTTLNIFGCEIEPFKQAFLLRNSRPQYLFRDVEDFAAIGAQTAHLVSGVSADIPDVDLFVAGTSCVDFSALNSNRTKEFEGLTSANMAWKKLCEARREMDCNQTLTRDDMKYEDWRKCIDGLMQKKGSTRASSTTFAGAMNYIYERQPKIVIFENVETAPWQSTTSYVFPLCGYAATFVKLDTKNYYLPQTRSRKYLIAFNHNAFGHEGAKALCDAFVETTGQLQQKYSSSITDFLLPVNSHELNRARNEMEIAAQSMRDRDTDWSFSRSRHLAFRRLNDLPNIRPWIQWSEKGTSNAPANMWKPWEAKQTNRVSDLLDCVFLVAIHGKNTKHSAYDPRFKAQIIDCSQNVDRVNMATAFGATGCLTPSAIPILTLEARPITGSEALKLQGLPIENLDMSIETQAQLQDLAGNAMTTTVVGATILAALASIAEHDHHNKLGWLATLFEKGDFQDARSNNHNSFNSEMTSLDVGVRKELDVVLSAYNRPSLNVGEIVQLGRLARRRCVCCHILSYSSMELFVCKVCDTWLCKSCKGNPAHDMSKFPLTYDQIGSLSFANAEARLREYFPAILPMHGSIVSASMSKLRSAFASVGHENTETNIFIDAIVAGLSNTIYELGFVEVTEVTRIEYVAKDCFIIRVILDKDDITWTLHADEWSEAGQRITKSFGSGQPMARCVLSLTACCQFPMDWQFWLPCRTTFQLRFSSGDDRQLHLELMPGTQNLPRRLQREVQFLRGSVWEHHPECGFPENALWVHHSGLTKFFLFKDVNPIGSADKDEFVISTVSREMGRTPIAETRPVVLRISSQCQIHQILKELEANDQPARSRTFIANAFVTGHWLPTERDLFGEHVLTADSRKHHLRGLPLSPPVDFRLVSSSQTPAYNASGGLQVSAADHGLTGEKSCYRDQLLLTMSLPILGKSAQAIGASIKTLKDLDLTQQLDFAEFCRLVGPCYTAVERAILGLETLGVGHGKLQIAEEDLKDYCDRCAPQLPAVEWAKPNATTSRTMGSVIATHQEPDQQAYETNISSKPLALRIDHNVDPHLIAHSKKMRGVSYVDVRIVGRVHTLMQEARSHLPTHPAFCEQSASVRATFALEVGLLEDTRPIMPSLAIQAPKALKQLQYDVKQPPGFRHGQALFEEQLASLEWMLSRENDVTEFEFIERETAEVYMHQLRLRAVSRVTRPIARRGRVVADSVGFGKTAVCLGLIDRQNTVDRDEFTEARMNNTALAGMVHLHATLIIVPNQLTDQWRNEAQRFLNDNYKICVLQTFARLQHMSIDKLKEADIIICSNRIFQDPGYHDELCKYCNTTLNVASMPKVYRAWYQQVQSALGTARVEIFRIMKMSAADSTKALVNLSAILNDAQGGAGTFPPSSTLTDRQPLLLLEMFSFSRVIWDEFPYTNVQVTEFVAHAAAMSKWMLSGTPPLATLGDVCKIAYLFNAHLASPLALVKGRQPPVCEYPPEKPLSSLEEAVLYTSRHSTRLLQERHQQAVNFVDKFMRKNSRAMKEITSIQKPLVLSQSTNALIAYLELQQELRSRTFNANAVAADPRRRLMSLVDWKVKLRGTDRAMEALTIRASASFNDVQKQTDRLSLGSGQSTLQVAEALYNISVKNIRGLEDLGRELLAKAIYLAYRSAFISLREHVSKLDVQESRHFNYYQSLEAFIGNILDIDVARYSGWDALGSALRMLIWDDSLHQELDAADNLDPKLNAFASNQEAWKAKIGALWDQMSFGVAPAEIPLVKEKGRAPSLHKKKAYLEVFAKLLTKTPLHSRRWFLVHEREWEKLPVYVQNLLEMEWTHKVPWETTYKESHPGAAHLLVPINELRRPPVRKPVVLDYETIQAQDRARIENLDVLPAPMIADIEARVATRAGKTKLSKLDWQEECTRLGLISKTLEPVDVLRKRVIKAELGKASEEDYISPEGCLPKTDHVPLEGKQSIRGGNMEVCFDQLMHTVDKLSLLTDRLVVAHSRRNLQQVIVQVLQGKWSCSLHPGPQALDTHHVSLDCGHIHCSLPQDNETLQTVACGIRGCTRHLSDVCIPLSKLSNSPRVIHAADLGPGALHLDPASYLDPNAEQYGPKANLIVKLIHAMSATDQVVIFAQNQVIMADIYAALASERGQISYVSAADLLHNEESAALEAFKQGMKRVLVQMINSEQAAGSNLHNANHVVFVSPLITRSQAEWTAQMQQALGRCVRFRQEKTVHVYHLAIDETIEVDTLEWRMKKEVLVAPGRAVGRFNDCTAAEFLDRFDASQMDVEAARDEERRAISLLPRDDIQMLMGDDYIALAAARTSSTVDSAKAGGTICEA